MKPWTGIGLKIVERSGDKLEDLLHKSDPWEDQDCLRSDCITCKTSAESDKIPYKNCKKRSIIYETWCKTCQKQELRVQDMLENESDLNLKELFNDTPSDSEKKSEQDSKGKRKKPESDSQAGPYYRYIGESSRSVYERSLEHLSDLKYSRVRSHMLKHCILKHRNMDPSSIQFGVKVISNHKSAFERQIKEAVLINRNSGPFLLNSKSEYSRCTIPRIVMKMGSTEAEEDPEVVEE